MGLAPGAAFGHLEIERELGRGGFATVYLARDARLGRQVALKVLSTPNASAVEVSSFLDEARLIARLHHPHVVTLFQLHELESAAFALEMEFVPGGTLAQAGPLTHEQVERCLRGVLAGLGAAHANGVLHRDIKPANILVSPDGEAKLTDFGLARMAGDTIDLDDGAFGTPLYMAPELLVGGRASERTDLWSVGVVAYELLAGRRPFPSGNAAQFFAALQNEDPAPLPPAVPPSLRALVATCLGKEPADRPASCDDALALLDRPAEMVAEPAPAPVAAAALHGRAAALACIEEALATLPGAANVLLVTGAAGIGKTALCEEGARRARERGVLWIDARLSPIEGPLTTLVDAVRAATLGGEDPTTARFGPGGARLKRVLLGDELPALDSPQQAMSALRQLITGVANTRPLALCVDDAQHASEEDVTFLASLARWLSDRPFTLIAASRPETPATAGLGETQRVELGSLTREALYALLEDRLEAGLPARAAARIFERTDGNPLHALELARWLEETGALIRKDGRLELHGDWESADVPARLRDVVHARLASLDEQDRALIEVAAVDGREFDGGALAAVLGLPVLQVLRRLQTLCRGRTLIAPAPRGYRFTDPPTQEVVYADLAPELRTEVHRALAQHLDAREEDVEPARLARHWEACGERARAAPYLVRVAQGARERQEARRFVDLAERAGMLDDPPLVDLKAHLELALALASHLGRLGRGAESEALYTRLLQGATDDETRLGIEVRRAIDAVSSGKRPEHDAAYWNACADRLGDTLDGGLARTVIGMTAKVAGDLDAAKAAFEDADRIFQACGNDWNHSRMLGQLGAVAMRASRLDDARRLYGESAEVAARTGLETNAAVSRLNATLASMLAGEIEGAEAALADAIRTFELAGAAGTAAHSRLHLAEAQFAAGKTGMALESTRAALPVLEKTGHRLALTNAWRLRAELEAVTDDLDGAAQSIARALEYAEGGDPIQLFVAHAVDALVATAQERPDDAARAVAAMRAADPDHSHHADGVALVLGEAVLFGLPPSEFASVASLIRSDQEFLLRDAVLAHAEGSSCAEPLRKLEAIPIGLRRVSYRLLTNWLAAADARRTGDTTEARKRTAIALEAATVLGHVRAQARIRAPD